MNKMNLPVQLYFALFSLLLIACNNPQAENTQSIPVNGSIDNNNPSNTPPKVEEESQVKEDYINTNRVIWQKPDMVIDLLGDLQEKTVADIGAGTGFFALRLVPKAQKVIALDIEQEFVSYLDSIKQYELPEGLQDRLIAKKSETHKPNLAPEEIDIAVIVNTYMYIDNRVDYLGHLKDSVKPGGKVLIIDFKKKRTPIGPSSEMRKPAYQVEDELYKAGFDNVKVNDTALDYQYIVMAEKT